MLRIHIHMLRIHILALRIHFSGSFHSLISKTSVKFVILTMANYRTLFTDLMTSNISIMNFS